MIIFDTCPGGEIGRRRGLKIPRRKVCRFESDPGHQIKNPYLILSRGLFYRSQSMALKTFLLSFTLFTLPVYANSDYFDTQRINNLTQSNAEPNNEILYQR